MRHDALPDRGVDRFAGHLRLGRRSFHVAARRLFARVGYASWESELAPFATQDRSGSDPTYGAGAQVRLGSFLAP